MISVDWRTNHLVGDTVGNGYDTGNSAYCFGAE